MPAPSATTTLYARPPKTLTRRKLTVALGPAAVVNRWEARCPVAFTGEKPFFVYGVDTFQALGLAVRYVCTRLDGMMDDGWRFFLTRNGSRPSDVTRDWGCRPALWPTIPTWAHKGARRRSRERNNLLETATGFGMRVVGATPLGGHPRSESQLNRRVLRALRSAIEPGARVVVSDDARKVPFLGSTVAPAIALHGADEAHVPLVAIELGLAKSEEMLSQAVARAVGRALIYRLTYPRALISVVNATGPRPTRDVTDEELTRRLAEVGIFLGVRSARRSALHPGRRATRSSTSR